MIENLQITAGASYLPPTVVTNQQLSELMDTSDDWIQAHTGIKTRHYALNETTSQMATKVAKSLLQKAKLTAQEIDLIIVATISPDAHTPATAALVQANIQATNAFAYDISSACAGFVFALSTAEKFLRAPHYRKALVICAESNAKMLDFQDRTSAVFFGDGAAGVLVEKGSFVTDCFLAEKLATQGNDQVIHSGRVMPLTKLSATNYPKMSAFYQDGRAVYEFVTTTILQHMQHFLASQKQAIAKLDKIIVHQANLRLIEFLAQELKAPLDKFPINVTYAGNTSSVGIALGLVEVLEQMTKPSKVLLTGFGAGLAYGSILLQLNN